MAFNIILKINIYQIQSENKRMSINIKLKFRSLLRRGQKFFCLSFDWDTRQIVVHRTQQEYFNQLLTLKSFGVVKRAECYLDEPFSLSKKDQYLIYMISFGDFRKGKMVRGQNPIAKGLGVCLFDYVFVFLDDITQAQRRMETRIQQMEKRGQFFHRNLMLLSYCKFFKDRQETTETQHCTPAKEIDEQQSFEV